MLYLSIYLSCLWLLADPKIRPPFPRCCPRWATAWSVTHLGQQKHVQWNTCQNKTWKAKRTASSSPSDPASCLIQCLQISEVRHVWKAIKKAHALGDGLIGTIKDHKCTEHFPSPELCGQPEEPGSLVCSPLAGHRASSAFVLITCSGAPRWKAKTAPTMITTASEPPETPLNSTEALVYQYKRNHCQFLAKLTMNT